MTDEQIVEAVRRALRDAAIPRVSFMAMVDRDGDDPKIMIQGVYSLQKLATALHRELGGVTT